MFSAFGSKLLRSGFNATNHFMRKGCFGFASVQSLGLNSLGLTNNVRYISYLLQ